MRSKSHKTEGQNTFWLASLFFLIALWASQANAACSIGQIESGLRRAFPGWKVVRIEDLRRDDQGLWEKDHPRDCPGSVQGYFQSNGTLTSALTVFKSSDDGLEQMLLVANVNDGKYEMSVLAGPTKVAYLSVISRAPPGTHSTASGKKIEVRVDAILYEAIEAGSVLYYFDVGRYKSVTLEE